MSTTSFKKATEYKIGDMVWCRHIKHLKDTKVKGMVLNHIDADKLYIEIQIPLSKEDKEDNWVNREILLAKDVIPFSALS